MWNPAFDWDNEGWRDRAACRCCHPKTFFPLGSTGAALDHIQAAKSICRSCPVQDACLDFALATNQEAGIWGGTDEEERRRIQKARRAGRLVQKHSVMT